MNIDNNTNLPPAEGAENAPKIRKAIPGDLPDNAHDEARMQPEEFILDLPDVKDIPGQEFIHPPVMESFIDTTISSDDEEGVGILDDETEEEDDLDADHQEGTEADVSAEEKTTLEKAATDIPTHDNINLRMAELDQVDDEGDVLNEGSHGTDVSGSDIDTTIVDADNRMENIGAEDEENNTYSLGGDNNDDVSEGTT